MTIQEAVEKIGHALCNYKRVDDLRSVKMGLGLGNEYLKLVAETMLSLQDRREPTDFITVVEELVNYGMPRQVATDILSNAIDKVGDYYQRA